MGKPIAEIPYQKEWEKRMASKAALTDDDMKHLAVAALLVLLRNGGPMTIPQADIESTHGSTLYVGMQEGKVLFEIIRPEDRN